jgi:uncharacterized protein YceK
VNRSSVVLAALAAISVAGCASVEQQQSAEPKAERTYTTGSRIPVRDGSGSTHVTAIENKGDIQDIGTRSGMGPGAPKGMGN